MSFDSPDNHVYTMSCGHELDSPIRRSEGVIVNCSMHGPVQLVEGDFITHTPVLPVNGMVTWRGDKYPGYSTTEDLADYAATAMMAGSSDDVTFEADGSTLHVLVHGERVGHATFTNDVPAPDPDYDPASPEASGRDLEGERVLRDAGLGDLAEVYARFTG